MKSSIEKASKDLILLLALITGNTIGLMWQDGKRDAGPVSDRK